MGTEPNPFQFTTDFRNGLDYIPADRKGRFQVFTGSFKEAMDNAGVAGYPFSKAWYQGSTSWSNNDNTIKLREERSVNGGAIHFTLARNWSCLFQLETSNSDFFDDELVEQGFTYNPDDEARVQSSSSEYPYVMVSPDDGFTGNANSFALIGLMEGDYLSIDVDADFSDTAQMRVRIDGVDYFDNTKPNEDVWVKMYFMRVWDSEYEWPPEPTTDPITDPITDPLPIIEGDCPDGYELQNGICVFKGDSEPLNGGGSSGEPNFDLDAIEVSEIAILAVLSIAGYILILAIRNR